MARRLRVLSTHISQFLIAMLCILQLVVAFLPPIANANTFSKPCALFETMPKSNTLSRCYPVSIDVVWDIVEKHTAFPDDPEDSEPVDLRWLISNHLEGELLVYSKLGCRKLNKSCVEYFRFGAPGVNHSGQQYFTADIRNASIRIVYRDDYGKPVLFNADTPKFFLSTDRFESGKLGFNIYPSEKQSEGHIDAPEFGWSENGSKQIWSKIGALRICSKNNNCSKSHEGTVVLNSGFLPDFNEVLKLIEGKGYKKSVPINYVRRQSFRKTEKRIIKGKVNYRISLETSESGKLIVSPSNIFEASRESENGKYRPRSKHYTLTNTGKKPIAFKVKKNVKWLKVHNAKGTLAPKQSIRATIALTAAADKLKGDKNKTFINFVNTTSHKGDTSRKVVLKNIEKWRLSIFGHNHLVIGSGIVFGIRASWRTDVEFEIEDGKYKSGSGRSYFVQLEPYSNKPSVAVCRVIKGNYIDKFLKNNTTPYIEPRSYSVSGNVTGNRVSLNLPREILYQVDYSCKVSEEIRKAGTLTDEGVQALLFNTVNAPLKHGWVHHYGSKKSIDYRGMSIIKLE